MLWCGYAIVQVKADSEQFLASSLLLPYRCRDAIIDLSSQGDFLIDFKPSTILCHTVFLNSGTDYVLYDQI